MASEGKLKVVCSTICRWVYEYALMMDKRLKPYLKTTDSCWRLDETYIQIKGICHYLYRAIDRSGQTLYWMYASVVIKAHLIEVTYLTAAEVMVYIKKKYGKKYAMSSMTNLLHRLEFVHKEPALSPCKVDAVKQLEFLQKYEKIRRSENLFTL